MNCRNTSPGIESNVTAASELTSRTEPNSAGRHANQARARIATANWRHKKLPAMVGGKRRASGGTSGTPACAVRA